MICLPAEFDWTITILNGIDSSANGYLKHKNKSGTLKNLPTGFRNGIKRMNRISTLARYAPNPVKAASVNAGLQECRAIP